MFTRQKIRRMVFIYFNFNKILTHANPIDRMHVNARENEVLITFLPALFFSFQQECFTSGNTWDKASNVKNRTKTSYDVMHVGQGMPNKVSYRPPGTWSIIGHSTINIHPASNVGTLLTDRKNHVAARLDSSFFFSFLTNRRASSSRPLASDVSWWVWTGRQENSWSRRDVTRSNPPYCSRVSSQLFPLHHV